MKARQCYSDSPVIRSSNHIEATTKRRHGAADLSSPAGEFASLDGGAADVNMQVEPVRLDRRAEEDRAAISDVRPNGKAREARDGPIRL